MKILFDEIKGSIYYHRTTKEGERNHCLSGIRYYGCNPTLLSLFLVKSHGQMVQSSSGIVFPIIWLLGWGMGRSRNYKNKINKLE